MDEGICGNEREGWVCSLPQGHSDDHKAYGGHQLIPGEFCTSWLNDSPSVTDAEVAAAIASIQMVAR